VRHVDFREPNFQIEVKDPGGNQETWLIYAADEPSLRQRFENNAGWTIQSVTPYSFATWQQRAKDAADAVKRSVDRSEKPAFNSAIWTELKQFLFMLFHNKCAYCETRVRVSDWGDVEHYRPKAKVEEDPQHPGYYWLAYDVTNLLPCCKRCNQARGKMNHFPIAGARATRPDADLAAESPNLVHPYEPSAEQFLRFVVETGRVVGNDDRGNESIRVYNLNRGDLVNERVAAWENVRQAIGIAMATGLDVLKAKLEEYRAGAPPFSAVGVTTLRQIGDLFSSGPR
jgi:uncharacterized protein (TIGR02646 family)